MLGISKDNVMGWRFQRTLLAKVGQTLGLEDTHADCIQCHRIGSDQKSLVLPRIGGIEMVPANAMEERLEHIRLRIEGLPIIRAFLITWFDPLLTPGKTTFENDVLRLAGVVSITADVPQYYPRYSLEQVLVKDPDVILTIEHEGDPLPDFKIVRGWKDLRAVKEGKVYSLKRRGGQLVALSADEKPFFLFPKSETKFKIKFSPMSVSFNVDESGKVKGLTMKKPGEKAEAKKIN